MAPISYADVMSRNIAAARTRARLDQANVAARMQALGFGNWYAQTVGKTEKGDRRLLAHEIAGLAFALETSVARLMAPLDEDHSVKLQDNGPSVPALVLRSSATGQIVVGAVSWDGDKPMVAGDDHPPVVTDVIQRMAARTWPPSGEEAQPVVAAIVTSERGVLVGKRRDGKPPWTFIAGEQDAVQDESPADTAVREVKEETGLRIVAGEVIGERDHPKTGRHMIYVAAKPALRAGLDVIVGDTDELEDVDWFSLARADELMPGMFGPVHAFLTRVLGEADG
jgi:8-oxo-dGTP diphosphatase